MRMMTLIRIILQVIMKFEKQNVKNNNNNGKLLVLIMIVTVDGDNTEFINANI